MENNLKLIRTPDDFSLLGRLGNGSDKDYVAEMHGVYYHAYLLEEGEEVDETITLLLTDSNCPTLDLPLFLARDEAANRNGFLFPLHDGGSLSSPQVELPSFSSFVEAIYLALNELSSSRVFPVLDPDRIYFEEESTYLGYPLETSSSLSLIDLAAILTYFCFVSLNKSISYEELLDDISSGETEVLEELDEEERDLILYLLDPSARLSDISRWLNGTLDLHREEAASGFPFLDAKYFDLPSLIEAFQDHFNYAIPVIENYSSNNFLSFIRYADPTNAEMVEYLLNESVRDPSLGLFKLIHFYNKDADFIYGSTNYVSVENIAHQIQSVPVFTIHPSLVSKEFVLASLSKDDAKTRQIKAKLTSLYESYPHLAYEASKAALANSFKESGYLYFEGHKYSVKEFAKASLRLFDNDLGAKDLLSDPQSFLSIFLLSDGSVAQEIVMPLLNEKDTKRFLCKLCLILNNSLPFYHEGDDISDPMDLIRLCNEAYESGGEEDKEFFVSFLTGVDLEIMAELYPSTDVLVAAASSSDPLRELYFKTMDKPRYQGKYSSVEEVVSFVLSSPDPEQEAKKLKEDPAFAAFLDYCRNRKKSS